VEGIVRGGVCRSKIGYTGPKTFQNVSQDATIKTISAWHKQLKETGSVYHMKGTGHPHVSDEKVDRIYRIFVCSLHKST
jgi:hypothetical protein